MATVMVEGPKAKFAITTVFGAGFDGVTLEPPPYDEDPEPLHPKSVTAPAIPAISKTLNVGFFIVKPP